MSAAQDAAKKLPRRRLGVETGSTAPVIIQMRDLSPPAPKQQPEPVPVAAVQKEAAAVKPKSEPLPPPQPTLAATIPIRQEETEQLAEEPAVTKEDESSWLGVPPTLVIGALLIGIFVAVYLLLGRGKADPTPTADDSLPVVEQTPALSIEMGQPWVPGEELQSPLVEVPPPELPVAKTPLEAKPKEAPEEKPAPEASVQATYPQTDPATYWYPPNFPPAPGETKIAEQSAGNKPGVARLQGHIEHPPMGTHR